MITILLAAYNGASYLAEQVESILAQGYPDWQLVIQDDCSTDQTAEIAKRYCEREPERVRFVQRATPSGSAKANFSSMLSYAQTEYAMTCDQDDVWLPDKLQKTMEEMHRLEQEYGKETPLLVHTDLAVVNGRLETVAPSLFHLQKLNAERDRLNNLLVQNIVTGCTMCINRPLLERAGTVPEEALMHDWWFALIGAAFGKIGFVRQSTVLYRQHGGNAVGAKDAGSLGYIGGRLRKLSETKAAVHATFLQAQAFHDRYENELLEKDRRIIAQYLEFPKANRLKKWKMLFQYDFWKSGTIRRIGQLFLM